MNRDHIRNEERNDWERCGKEEKNGEINQSLDFRISGY
jgi:hypothetical protein